MISASKGERIPMTERPINCFFILLLGTHLLRWSHSRVGSPHYMSNKKTCIRNLKQLSQKHRTLRPNFPEIIIFERIIDSNHTTLPPGHTQASWPDNLQAEPSWILSFYVYIYFHLWRVSRRRNGSIASRRAKKEGSMYVEQGVCKNCIFFS